MVTFYNTGTSDDAVLNINLCASIPDFDMFSRNVSILRIIILQAEADGDDSGRIYAVICDHWSNITPVFALILTAMRVSSAFIPL
jgi:hypothetical protein